MPVIAAGAAAERRLIERLMRARAFTAADAQPLSDLRFLEARRLPRLIRTGVVREDTPGRYYLDGPALADRMQFRRRLLAIAITSVMLIMMALLVMTMQTAAR